MSERPLRVGIIGCGNVGAGLHLPAWQAHPEAAEVVALADPSSTTLEAARITAGLDEGAVHSDPMDLIRRDDVDAVDVCTPQHLRRDILTEAARAGKHILCEKPLAAVPADAAEAVTAASRAGVTLAMVHNYVFLPEVRAAKRAIDSGEIGDVRSVIVNFLGVVDVPGSAAYQADWRHDPARAGGGVLIDMLHGVYLAEHLLGEPLERVSAYVDSMDHTAGVEDLALCRLESASRAALVNIGWGHGTGGVEVAGTKGRIAIRYRNGATAPWAVLEHVMVATPDGVRIELDGDGFRLGANGIAQALYDTFDDVVLDFAESVSSGRSPTASGKDGQRMLEATVGAYKSGATGRIVELPLEVEDPTFRHGVLGLRELTLPIWSPLRRGSLFSGGKVA